MSAWIPVVSVAVGGLIGVLGTLLGVRLQIKEAARARVEQYTREDRYRLNRDRIDAYASFDRAMGHARNVMSSSKAEQSVLVDARDEVWARYSLVMLVGEQQVIGVVKEMMAYVNEVLDRSRKFDAIECLALVRQFRAAARGDLIGVGDRPRLRSGSSEW